VQGNTKVIHKDGQIVYDDENMSKNALLYNAITTPKGRQYQLTLADGSKVWLNAASSIRYPTAFPGNERVVEITGEAYFEITPDRIKPFRVFVKGMEVQVLGTHFNINSYDDEATIKTTLLEGSVKVKMNNNTRLLLPGQQAQISSNAGDGDIKVVKDIDLAVVMAWKNGYFSFDKTDLGAVMRQISRWYIVDIIYTGKIPDRKFGGEISRNNNLSEVLKILEESKVKFRIEGAKIFVLP
jgi:ferric-dicitrate binding protein FerR (iron transport regulator)